MALLSSSDEPSSSFEDAWERFQALKSLPPEDEGWVPAAGRAQMLAFLIRVEDRAARKHAAAIAERIADIQGVQITPEEHWHITVKAAGFQVIKRAREDDVLREDVGRLGREAGAVIARHVAYEAQIGLPNAFAGGIYLEIDDAGATANINSALADQELIATYPIDGANFLPHMTIAGLTSSDALPSIKAALADLRTQGTGPSFTVTRIDFVKAWFVEDGEPEVETLASLRLAAS